MRKLTALHNGWLFSKDPMLTRKPDAEGHSVSCVELPESAFEAVTVPHTWNAIDGQDGGNDYYRGVGLYKRTLTPGIDYAADLSGRRVILEINGSGHTTEVLLNGVTVGRHAGGYSTFRVDLTEHLEAENELAILVSNEDSRLVYPQKADFTFYGGLYREVRLLEVPDVHFECIKDGSNGIKVTPVVDLATGKATVTVETWQNCGELCEKQSSAAPNNLCDKQTSAAPNNMVMIHLEQDGQCIAKQEVPSVDGHAEAVFTIENAHLWDGMNDPYLYTAVASLKSGDEVRTRFGIREFHMDPEKGFFLNGKSYPLRGVSRHQDRRGKGNALSLEDHSEDIAIIKEMGANTIRLAHYQHAQEFYDLCDENGLVLWAEIPYITMHMTEARENTLSQMKELVTQCYNHPSIVVWGLSNEITAASAVNEDLIENHRLLNDLCHRLDATRPTVMANVFMLEIDSPILEVPDINSYNLYFGWYLGDMDQTDEFFDEYHTKYPNRVIGFSEYGADANPRFHSPKPQKSDYTEEYQALYHEHMIHMIQERPYLWATHVWNMFDFAADGRDEGGEHGVNQKGLVTMDRKVRKDAFYAYQAAWSKEPMVHLCGSRYVDRAEETTEIKVYSNCDKVILYAGDEKVGEMTAKDAGVFANAFGTGNAVFTFPFPLGSALPVDGEVEITAEGLYFTHAEGQPVTMENPGEDVLAAVGVMDTITIRRVTEENPDYIFNKAAKAVNNWFDSETVDPTCFSVQDTLGELKQHPQAGAIIDAMMAKGASARGDVADAVKDNPALQRMMARMTLISLLKQGGVDEQSIKGLNRVLQGIKK